MTVEERCHTVRRVGSKIRCDGGVQFGIRAVNHKHEGALPALKEIGDEKETRGSIHEKLERELRRDGHNRHFRGIAIEDKPYE